LAPKPPTRFESFTNVFRPSTHTMHRDDSDVGMLMTQLDARRVSRMQNFLANQD